MQALRLVHEQQDKLEMKERLKKQKALRLEQEQQDKSEIEERL